MFEELFRSMRRVQRFDGGLLKPVLIGLQLDPAFVVLKTPILFPLAAYTTFELLGSIASVSTDIVGNPLTKFQLAPPFVLL